MSSQNGQEQDESTTSSTDSEDNEDTNSETESPLVEATLESNKRKGSPSIALPEPPLKKLVLARPATKSREPPRMRIKLSLKLPKSASKKPPEEEVMATVVDSDEGGDDDEAVAAVVEAPKRKSASGSAKRRSLQSQRPVKMPPIASPGLLLLSSSQNAPVPKDSNGFVTAASVFTYHMAQAGYTTERRTKEPHRGSSVERVVADMFDTDITLSLRFPPLVPPELESDENGVLPKLLESLEKSVRKGNGMNSSRKRRRPWAFHSMVPLSLSIPYPESFIEKRKEYIGEVDARERAIVAYQNELEELEIAKELSSSETPDEVPKTVIPPIPKPPSPPRLLDMEKVESMGLLEDKHPLYPPTKHELVAHLDQNTFHITEGRYFGFSSNWTADPSFVGANAPGLSGSSAAGVVGLATSSTGTSTSGGMTMVLSTGYHSAAAGYSATTPRVLHQGGSTPSKAPPPIATHSEGGILSGSPTGTEHSFTNATVPEEVISSNGSHPTASLTDLKKIMEEGGPLAESMRDCIIRAAVHASRSGRTQEGFLAPNGESYPDASKAFSVHAGIKPCQRCKNNKQGAFHCRLRRRHKDLDFDGTNSLAKLTPLLDAPMDSLLNR